MNIFINLNVSNDSNFESDSGYVFQKLVLKNIADAYPSHKFFFLGHKKNSQPFHANVTMVPLYDRYDKFSTRFNFDWHGLKAVIEGLPAPDVFINNQPEHTLAFKMLLGAALRRDVPFISYFHYLPFHYEGDSIVYDDSQNLLGFSAPYILQRNLEAMDLSDLSLVGSQFGVHILKKAYKDFYQRDFTGRLEVFSPPVEKEILDASGFSGARASRKRVLLNQRLYRHYGIDKILETLDDLSKDYAFELVITDPTGKRSAERNKLDPHVNDLKSALQRKSYVSMETAETREQYHALLSSVDLGIAPWKPSALWSMAVADLLAAGRPVICPDAAAFPELVPHSPEMLVPSLGALKNTLAGYLEKNSVADKDSIKSNVLPHHEATAARRYANMIESVR